jgi:transcriptional regulator with XRE-family HTH domain
MKLKLIEALKQAIKASGESQNAIAKACGLDQPNINAFMHGKRSISLESAEKIALHLGLTLKK